jgi:hypothetical protein
MKTRAPPNITCVVAEKTGVSMKLDDGDVGYFRLRAQQAAPLRDYALPIRSPAIKTRAPPSITCVVAEKTGVSM